MKKLILTVILFSSGLVASIFMSTALAADSGYSPSCEPYWGFSSAAKTCTVEKIHSSGGSGPGCTLINVTCQDGRGGHVNTPRYPATGEGIYYPALANLYNCGGHLQSDGC